MKVENFAPLCCPGARKLFGARGRYPDVILNDLYTRIIDHALCDSCYPTSCDCPAIQDDGVHFSPRGDRYNAVNVAYHVAPHVPTPRGRSGARPTIEEGPSSHRRWKHWQLALIVQAALLAPPALLATYRVHKTTKHGGAAAGRTLLGLLEPPDDAQGEAL